MSLLTLFRAPRESADSRVAWFAGGPGRAGDEFILAGSPGPAGASYLLTIFFFFEVSDSDLRLSRLIAKLGNEIMYTIK